MVIGCSKTNICSRRILVNACNFIYLFIFILYLFTALPPYTPIKSLKKKERNKKRQFFAWFSIWNLFGKLTPKWSFPGKKWFEAGFTKAFKFFLSDYASRFVGGGVEMKPLPADVVSSSGSSRLKPNNPTPQIDSKHYKYPVVENKQPPISGNDENFENKALPRWPGNQAFNILQWCTTYHLESRSWQGESKCIRDLGFKFNAFLFSLVLSCSLGRLEHKRSRFEYNSTSSWLWPDRKRGREWKIMMRSQLFWEYT